MRFCCDRLQVPLCRGGVHELRDLLCVYCQEGSRADVVSVSCRVSCCAACVIRVYQALFKVCCQVCPSVSTNNEALVLYEFDVV